MTCLVKILLLVNPSFKISTHIEHPSLPRTIALCRIYIYKYNFTYSKSNHLYIYSSKFFIQKPLEAVLSTKPSMFSRAITVKVNM